MFLNTYSWKYSNAFNPKEFYILLDRDGTMIKNVPYLKNIENIIFFEDIINALISVRDKVNLIVITNQSGIGRNKLSHTDLEAIHRYIYKYYLKFDLEILGFIYCPHLPENLCECRKPNTGMFEFAKIQFKFARKKSLMIGDTDVDKEAARLFGIDFYKIDSTREEDLGLKSVIQKKISYER